MTNLAKRFTLILLAFFTIIPITHAQEPNWTSYDALLKRHLTTKTHQGITLKWLDYPAVKQDPIFAEIVTTLQNHPLDNFTTQKQKIAFYINAYNIFAIKMVLDHWPVESIKDAGSWFNSVWKKQIGTLDGAPITLDEIEHKILRPMKEPRIHMAIVCASLSCPDLRNEAYTADKLDHQLNDQTQQFLTNASKGLIVQQNKLTLSKIFDWFETDFSDTIAFIRQYRPDIPANATIDGYMDYNWSLNGAR
ncbi:MAG: DUF547 domain-containing protein [Magnetococcales bacterium]|nr:DUF547 domain-containing protein [Magnetococcales bacterium]